MNDFLDVFKGFYKIFNTDVVYYKSFGISFLDIFIFSILCYLVGSLLFGVFNKAGDS